MRPAILSFFVAMFAAPLAQSAEPLPQGDEGIAAMYPGDVGIADHPDVVLAEDYEDYTDASQLTTKWAAVYQTDLVRLTRDANHVWGGSQALEFEMPADTNELANETHAVVNPERDVLFLRFYSKFGPNFDISGSIHNGGMVSGHYYDNGASPGIPANGTNKFLVNLENQQLEGLAGTAPGELQFYVYHPDQRSDWGDHFLPTGVVYPFSSNPGDFGPDFVSRPDFVPELDRWYCFEYMVQANTPGERDGRVAAWIDGELRADLGNLRFRDVESLKINRFGLNVYIQQNPGAAVLKWYDNVVAAGSYIGPVHSGEGGGTSGGTDSGGGTGTGTGTGGSEDSEGGGNADGGSAGPGEATDAGSAGGGDENTDATGDGGAQPSGTAGDAGASAGEGCGCRSDEFPGWWAGLTVLLCLTRRRRARLPSRCAGIDLQLRD